ncbi:chemotaxis protein CheW [Isosphaeraceae bacterium EP7]
MIDPTKAAKALSKAFDPKDPKAVRKILEARARQLARDVHDEPTGESTDLIVLAVGPEQYGVPLSFVQEIQPLRGVAAVPGTPAFWAGVVNLRGRLFPVLDLAAYLGLPVPQADARPAGQIVLVEASGLTVALWADEVAEARQVLVESIGPPLGDVGVANREVIRGVTPDLLTVLDLVALLADPRLEVRDL